jgi:predicted nucleotidyltransferase
MLMSAAPQVASEVGAKLNFMDFIDAYAEVLGVDPRLIRSDDEARAILQQMAEAQARQAQAEQMEREAKSMASLSKASLEGDTALRRLMGGA